MRTRSSFRQLLTPLLYSMCVGEPYCYSYLVNLDGPPALETSQPPSPKQARIKMPAVARPSWLPDTQR
jgi:hypothetical protein